MRVFEPAEPVPVAPAGDVSVTVLVRNDRDIVDEFVAVPREVPFEDARSEPVAMFPKDEGQVRVRFRVPPTVGAGPQQARVEVRSRADGQTSSVPVTLVVPARQMLSAALVPSALTARSRAATTLVLRNAGNVGVPMTLTATDPAGVLRFDLAQDLVVLGAGESLRIPMLVSGPRRLAGFPTPTFFSVVGEHPDGQALVSASGTFTIRPLLPRWLLALLPMLLVLLAWALIFLLAVQKAVRSAVPPEATLSGHVLSAEPVPLPVANAKVSAYRTGEPKAKAVASATTKADGSYTLEVPPGRYDLRATAEGFDDMKSELPPPVDAERRAKPAQVDIHLTGVPGSIAGTADVGNALVAVERLDTAGNPISAALALRPAVALFGDAPDGGAEGGGSGGGTGSTPAPTTTTTVPTPPIPTSTAFAVVFTDAKGAFSVADLPTPASYRLRFIKAGYAETVVDVALQAAEQKTGVKATVAPLPATLTGSVSVGGSPAGGVDIAVTDGKTTLTTKTLSVGAAGTFTVTGVPPGMWVVTAAYGSLPPTSVSVTAGPGTQVAVPPFAF